MKKNKIFLTGIFVVLISFSSMAQGGGIWNFNWNMGFPMGTTKDFIGNPSFRGFSLEGRGFVTDRITVGGIGAWSVFYENFEWILNENNTTKTYGYNRKYLNVMPLMVTAHYYFSQGQIQPYIGTGIGPYYIESRDFMGIYYVQGKEWHFGIAPEVGIIMPFGSSNAGVNINFKYNLAAKTKNQPSYTWLGINIGLSYLF